MSNLPQPTNELPQASSQDVKVMKRTQINPKFQIIQNNMIIPVKMRKKRKPPSAPKQKILPSALDGEFPESNANYTKMLQDTSIEISPIEMGFVPSSFWVSSSETFGDLVSNYFHKKNNSNCRFPHKLYNALQLVDKKPEFWPFVGVKWVTDSVFKVDKFIFGRLIGISAFDGGFFHSQGNFPSHGFQEVSAKTISQWASKIDLDGIDFDRVRLITHKTEFKRNIDENIISQLKWISSESKSVNTMTPWICLNYSNQ